LLLPILRSDINENRKKRENTKNILEENKKIYQCEKYIKTPRKLSKTGFGRLKYTRLENLTVYFRPIKALLAKKIQFEEGNLKLDV